LIDRPDRSLDVAWGSDHWLKDNSNTDVVLFNGRALTTFYQCGDGYVVDPMTLVTVGTLDLEAMGIRSLSAHSMVDEHTGELLFFDYATEVPYMTYGVLDAGGALKHHVPIDLPGPRLPHTLAFTQRYTILMDLPLFWDPELMKRDAHKVAFFPDLPSRFGIMPRYGDSASVRWFEAEPTYIYHICNAWEEGDDIVLDACRMRTPEPPPVTPGADISRMLAWGKLDASLYRYRFNLTTGETREEWRDDLFTEFPMINGRFAGRKSRYAYNMIMDDQSIVLRFDGLAKYDLDTGMAETWRFPAGCFASESPFAPRVGATAEDDGYVVTFVTDSATEASEIQVFDARNIGSGPVGRVKLPTRVPPGFHSCWAPAGDIQP
jgi:carotenoid cleavage dioxygenase